MKTIWDRIVHGLATDGPNELQQCILSGACYLQGVTHASYDRFPSLPLFNATKVFSPCNYPSNDSGRITNTELWLERILLKFQYMEEESDMCKGEPLEFTETLQHECENKTIFEAWRICGSNLEWHTNWSKFMQLWQKKIILIPSHITIYFPNKMQSKATCAIGWTWRPLMLLCGSLFMGLKWMHWIGLPSSTCGKTCKTKDQLHSTDSFFIVTNQDCISIIQYNISFSETLCNRKLTQHSKIKCICQLTFISVFEYVTWHFGSEAERQKEFVKYTHCLKTSSCKHEGI